MSKIIAKNKIANFDYEIVEKFETGISLMGWEVKSIRAGNVNLKGSFATFKDNELFISNMHISLYMAVKGDETRSRKLLMHRNELNRLELKQKQKGYSLIPLSIYWNAKSKIKVELGFAKGKNKADKRQSEREREEKKKIEKILKNFI